MNKPAKMPMTRYIPRLASLKITVVCLALLLVLTAWGTIYQAEYGLYAAQTRFFNSWFFKVGSFIPFPGGQLVLWILFVNLLASMLFRVAWSLANFGNIVSHAGLLFLLAGSFVTHRYATESYLPMREGELSNVSLDRRIWELAAWEENGDAVQKSVSTVEMSPKKAGGEFDFSEFGYTAHIRKYWRNADAQTGTIPAGGIANADGIGALVARRPYADPEDDLPGAVVAVRLPGESGEREMILYGGQLTPNSFLVQGRSMRLILRRKRYPLPFTLKLLDVRKEDYPGTGIARSYESDVEVLGEGPGRKTRIFMNNPLRHRGYTFFQSNYSADASGRETSVFAVVENRGRLIPYIASGMIFGGMVLHFLLRMFGRKGRTVREGA